MSNHYSSMIDRALVCGFDNISAQDGYFSGSRLIENNNREIVLISKTPAEVFGEQLLAPTIEKLTLLASQVISAIGAALQIPMQLAQSVSFPSLLPTVSAQPITTSDSTMEVIALLDRIRNQMPASNQPEFQDGTDSSIYVTEIQDVFDLIFTKYHEIQWERLDIPSLSSLKDREGNSLVLAAVRQGKEAELIHTLLENKIGFESQDPEGHSPLQLAAKLGHTHLIDFLSDHFSVDAKDSSQPSPMDLTIIEGHEDTFEELVSMTGLSKGVKTSNGIQLSSLELSVVFGRHSMFKKLRKKPGAQLNQFNPKVGNLLHLAIHAGQVKMVNTILELTRDQLLEQQDPEGRTPLHLAAYLGDLEAIRKIGTILKKPNIVGGQKWTPLHWAAHGKQPEAVKLLWKMGANPQLNNANYKSPLDLPSLQGARSNPEARRTIAQLEKCSNKDAYNEPLSPLDTRFYPRQLVISGTGEVLSAIDQIQDTEGMDYVSRIGGISRGSLTAALMAIGLSGPELEQTLAKGFERLDQGIDPFTEWLENVIKDETNTPDCTFEDLARLSEDNPAKYKELYLYAQNQEEVVFCAEDDQWKNLIISEGVAGAIAPSTGKYSPFFKHAGKERHTVPSIGTFFDASELVQKPSTLFDEHYYLGETAWGSPTNRATLELRGVRQIDDNCSERTICCSQEECHPEFLSGNVGKLESSNARQPITSWEEVNTWFSQIDAASIKTQSLRLPSPPNDFTGRKKELELLHKKCTSHKRVAITALGGTGKTALSLKYAEKYRSHYKFIHFVDGASINQDLLKLANFLNVPEGEPQERLDWLKAALEGEESKFLIIFDGIDHPEKFDELEPLLPESGKCLLLTSRMSEKARSLDFEVMKLDLLKPEEAIDYLTNQTEDKNRSTASKLAEELGYLPLALKHAASYIREENITFETYLKEFEKYTLELFKKDRLNLKKEEQTVLTTWRISLDTIKDFHKNPLAAHILEFFAYLEQAPIPRVLIKSWYEKVFPTKSTLDLSDALRLLSRYSLIESPSPNTFTVHPMMQRVTDFNLSESTKKEIVHQALPVFGNIIWGKNFEIPEERRKVDTFIPHIAKFADLSCEFFPDVECVADFTFLVGSYFLYDGMYEESLKYSRQILEIRNMHPGENELQLANSLANVGTSLFSLGKYDEALQYHKQALDLRKKLDGNNHIHVARSLDEVGACLQELGKYDEALTYQLKALELNKKLLGDDHVDLAKNLNNVGISFYQLGKYKKALDYQLNSLNLRKKILGENHPDVALSLNTLGLTLGELERYDEALLNLEQALKLNNKRLGENHPHTATTLGNVGIALGNLDKHNEALHYHQKALDLKIKLLGENHPIIPTNLNNVGGSFLSMGKYEEALKYAKQALELNKKHLGNNHSSVADTLNSVGVSLVKLKRYDEGLVHLQEALELNEKLLGKNHPKLATSYTEIGLVFEYLGRHNEALVHLQRALELKQKRFGENNLEMATSHNHLGLLLNKMGRHDEELVHLQKALELDKKLQGENHPDLAISLHNVGITLGKLDRHDEAIVHLHQALELNKKLFGKNSLEAAKNHHELGLSLDKLGRLDEALSHLKQTLQLNKNLLEENDPDIATSFDDVVKILIKLENYDEALTYQHQILELNKKLLGKNNLEVATDHNVVGLILGRLSRHDEALVHLQQALDLNKKLLGDNNLEVATNHHDVGLTLAKLSRHDEALVQLQQALDLNKKLLGENNLKVAINHQDVGLTLCQLEKYDQALVHLQQTLELDKRLLGENHSSVATSLHNVAFTLGAMGRHDEALEYFTQSFKVLCTSLSTKHPYHETFLKDLIQCLKHQTTSQPVKKIKAEILPLAIQRLGREHSLISELASIEKTMWDLLLESRENVKSQVLTRLDQLIRWLFHA